ncbi:MAG: hypothetical protein CVV42_20025 [Candidatus Riflebacteria bacterium HGW-Riflebacteria-2]|jgi:hypothetical protein|nr:MAG: hypothetical protein CVV42_20025 [Candidatus Riflebacteria bacterium HGW-Riflebacteria-2]
MKCEKFRTSMTNGGGHESELEEHLGNCPECAAWLEREIAEPPQGLTPAQWQAATARCFPEKLPETAVDKTSEKENEKEEPKSFWNSYFHGMTYGMVFGLSIVFGFALLSLRDDPAAEKPLPVLSEISFVESDERELPVFFEKNKKSVTFLQFENSELVSFVEFDNAMTFLDDDEEEKL